MSVADTLVQIGLFVPMFRSTPFKHLSIMIDKKQAYYIVTTAQCYQYCLVHSHLDHSLHWYYNLVISELLDTFSHRSLALHDYYSLVILKLLGKFSPRSRITLFLQLGDTETATSVLVSPTTCCSYFIVWDFFFLWIYFCVDLSDNDDSLQVMGDL